MYISGTCVLAFTATALAQVVVITETKTPEPAKATVREITRGMSWNDLSNYLSVKNARVATVINGQSIALMAFAPGDDDLTRGVVFILWPGEDGVFSVRVFDGETSTSSALDEEPMQLEHLRQKIEAALQPR